MIKRNVRILGIIKTHKVKNYFRYKDKHTYAHAHAHTHNLTAATKISKSMFQTLTTLILYSRKETLRKFIMQNF